MYRFDLILWRVEKAIYRACRLWWTHWLQCDIEQLILDGDEAGAIELREKLDRIRLVSP